MILLGWENGGFEIFNFWILIFGFVFLLFLFKARLDFNSCNFWFLILFLIFLFS